MARTAWFLIALITLAQPSLGRGQALDLDAAVDSITVQLAEQVGRAGLLRVATSDLLDSAGNPNELGRFVADRLAVRLIARAELQVVGRRELEPALDKLGLELADLVQPEKAAEAGALLNCDAVLVGRISDLRDAVEVTVRMVDVENGHALEEISALMRKNTVVQDLLRRKQHAGVERSDQPDADPGVGTAALDVARWPSIVRERIEFTLTLCPSRAPGKTLDGGTQLYCILALTNSSNRQVWIRVFEVGSYASDSEGVQIPLTKVYTIDALLKDGFYTYNVMLPRSGDRRMLLLRFGGSEQVGDVTSVVIRAEVGSSAPADLEFERIMP